MNDKTYKDIETEVKNPNSNKIKVNLTMVDVPIHIFSYFTGDVKEKYGNIYWVKLMDLMRKAEAYDFAMGTGYVPNVYENDEEEKKPKDKYGEIKKEEDDKGIYTFAGRRD
jgi:hypothetical protein